MCVCSGITGTLSVFFCWYLEWLGALMQPEISFSCTIEKLGRTFNKIGRTLEPCFIFLTYPVFFFSFFCFSFTLYSDLFVNVQGQPLHCSAEPHWHSPLIFSEKELGRKKHLRLEGQQRGGVKYLGSAKRKKDVVETQKRKREDIVKFSVKIKINMHLKPESVHQS